MERIAVTSVPRVARHNAFAVRSAAPHAASAGEKTWKSFSIRCDARGFVARRLHCGEGRASHNRWSTAPTEVALKPGTTSRRDMAGTPRAVVDTETSETQSETQSDKTENAKNKFEFDDDFSTTATVKNALDGLAESFSKAKRTFVDLPNRLQAKTRAATHPPLPVVATFEDLLRFANIAALNSASEQDICSFFQTTNERVDVLDMPSVKQRMFIATDDLKKRHTVSFRGTTNLTNVVQNIRLSNNPIVASGRLASVGRSLSGAFSGLARREEIRGREDTQTANDDSGSGSFDEDDDGTGIAEECVGVDWAETTPEELRTLGCTDHLPMHRGYRIIARECADALAPLMLRGYSVQLTGHSLGGAVAVATALLFRSRGVVVEKVVTFGAPKLGPRETREAAFALDVLRVVQKNDLVPLLPMSRPFVRKPYVHLGDGIVLDNDAPGRYARLTPEWGTAGILWKQRKHLSYARGGDDVVAVTDGTNAVTNGVNVSTVGTVTVANRVNTFTVGTATAAKVVSSEGSSARFSVAEHQTDSSETKGRFYSARARLRQLRQNLSSGIARRRKQFEEANAVKRNALMNTVSNNTVPNTLKQTPTEGSFVATDDSDSSQTFAREVAEFSREKNVSAGVGSDFVKADKGDPANFDGMEGELFVRVAETTAEGGAPAVAAAAADEWERAARASEKNSAPLGSRFFSRAQSSDRDASEQTVSKISDKKLGLSPSNEDYSAGPTIFEELWKLRGLDAEQRGDKLESHRMLRYVLEIEKAIAAGPVQTWLAGVYLGKKGDEIGIDFEGADGSDSMSNSGQPEGGVASWMTWTR